jgi:lysophospholipase L1-like esterase
LTTPCAKRWPGAALLVAAAGCAGATPLPVMRLDVMASEVAVAPLVCPAAPPKRPGASRPPARPSGPAPARPTAAEPTELPDEVEVQRALEEELTRRTDLLVEAAPAAPTAPAAPAPSAWPDTASWLAPASARPVRLAFWGDSHLAAGFFTEELARRLGPVDTLALPRLLPAGFGHAGVRGLVRRTCVGGSWVRESAHASAAAAQQPGPGLVSLISQGPGAELAWDLRDTGGEPRHRSVQLLYAATAGPVTVDVVVDGAPARTVVLPPGPPGAAVLELTSTGGPLSVLQLRVREGALRLQGLGVGLGMESSVGTPVDTASATSAPLQIDLFGYPGATVAGWANAAGSAHSAWFSARRYDVVALAYGTNEANDPGFRVEEYRAQLRRAVDQLRERFPEARGLHSAPGDGGVRVPRTRRGTRTDLLRFARLHAQIAAVQQDVARAAGCAAWSAQAAMGGAGSAYRWARQQPAWMAPDLIHFTPAGYRELARRLAADLGWTPR